MKGIARLTPKLQGTFHGKVHSVFDRVINLKMETEEGFRLLALARKELSPIPDSISLDFSDLAIPEKDDECFLSQETLILGCSRIALEKEKEYTGRVPLYSTWPTKQALSMLRKAAEGNGLALLPPQRRENALQAIMSLRAPEYVGLGAGLTPSYDDALVGLMAACQAQGLTLPFDPESIPFQDTTDVSARYLHLAVEGYFSQAVINVLLALHGQEDLALRLRELSKIGASSGKDMILGIQCFYSAKAPSFSFQR